MNLTTNEEWKDIPGYEGIYQISNLGVMRSIKRIIRQKTGQIYSIDGCHLKPCADGCGYLFVRLCKNGNHQMIKIHRAVANAFCLNPHQKPQVNHMDGNKKNNNYANLEWVTNDENMQHSWRIGLRTYSGEGAHNNKLSNKDVLTIRSCYIKGDLKYGAKPLARKYRVSNTTIRNIMKNKKWRHLNEINHSR
jgi:hypothetical protein